MFKRDGNWEETDWATALEFVATGLRRIRDAHGGDAIGALASPQSTLEELYLLGKFARGVVAAMSISVCVNRTFPGTGACAACPGWE